MIRFLLLACLWLITPPTHAEVVSFPSEPSQTELTIYSSGDTERFLPLIKAFQQENPGITIHYDLLGTVAVYDKARSDMDEGRKTADLLLSSAMDLQVKLVNDGYSQPHVSDETSALPKWANWRNEAFGFTYEPAVIIYNRKLAPDLSRVQTRFELAQLLSSSETQTLKGRIMTYDPARSGVGYMFDTHDAIQSEDFWFLVREMGQAGVKQAASTSEMIDNVITGEALMAYNVLGSYARAQIEDHPDLAITLPQDYCLIMSRVAVITREARHPKAAKKFIDFLLSRKGQQLIAGGASLYSLRSDIEGELTASTLREEAKGPLIPIHLGPGLLVYLDRLKREKFLSRWNLATQR